VRPDGEARLVWVKASPVRAFRRCEETVYGSSELDTSLGAELPGSWIMRIVCEFLAGASCRAARFVRSSTDRIQSIHWCLSSRVLPWVTRSPKANGPRTIRCKAPFRLKTNPFRNAS
jgi:hypothetical protein